MRAEDVLTKKELSERKLAYYEALLNAWLQTAMELDRSLLTLSVAGIGLLFALLTTHPEAGSSMPSWLYVLSIVGFSICTLVVLIVLQVNKAVGLEVIRNEHDDSGAPQSTKAQVFARRLDILAWASFGVGALALAVIAIGLATNSTGNTEMSKDSKPNVTVSMDSLSGVGSVSVQQVIKSYSGVSGLGASQLGQSGSPTNQSGSQSAGTTGNNAPSAPAAPPAPQNSK